jgi:hypothetical protein
MTSSQQCRGHALECVQLARKTKAEKALVLQVVSLSRQNPLLLIFEDAHWADPTSLELYGPIVDRIPTLRVLLIVTFRSRRLHRRYWSAACDTEFVVLTELRRVLDAFPTTSKSKSRLQTIGQSVWTVWRHAGPFAWPVVVTLSSLQHNN